MQVQSHFDFKNIKWKKIDREKAEFIYGEAIARLDAIHKGNDVINSKATGMLSVSMPVLIALIGFLASQWGDKEKVPLLAASVCAAFFLLAILVLLLKILIPRGMNSAQGEPATYLGNGYYLKSMETFLRGNIEILQDYIEKDGFTQGLRADLYRAAVLLYAIFPVISAVVWAVFFVCIKPCPDIAP
jgi:asparagine N-glycosylation enzyme membrane subunit Stt3